MVGFNKIYSFCDSIIKKNALSILIAELCKSDVVQIHFKIMAIKFVLKQNDSRRRNRDDSLPAEYVFDGDILTLGSDAANHIILADSAAEQAVVVREGERLTLMNSAVGTRLNGEDLRREAMHPLGGGDKIQIADYTILVVDLVVDAENEAADSEREAANGDSQPEKIRAPGENHTPPAAPFEEKTSNNFAAVLDTLRTEEDSFYFVVNRKGAKNGHVALEQPEIPLGVTPQGEIVLDIKPAAAIFGIVRKNWSGIVIEANRRGEIFVNDQMIEAGMPRQIRNNDRVTLTAAPESSLVLHEPSLLVALEPLLAARTAPGGAVNLVAGAHPADAVQSKPPLPFFERTFFGYFSFIEVMIMIITTLIGAVLFFLLFEFLFA